MRKYVSLGAAMMMGTVIGKKTIPNIEVLGLHTTSQADHFKFEHA